MAKIKSLSCDLETYSSVDLTKCGVYKYAESDDFEILLFGYSVDDGEVQVVDLAQGEVIPKEILKALTDDKVTKWAFNALFERICLSKYLGLSIGEYLNPKSWKCTMIWSAYMGLPLSLKGVGAVLKLDEQKLDEGKALIKYFCVPCKPTKVNGGRTRNYPHHNVDKWELFKAYNKRDVEVEMNIQKKLEKFPVPDFVWEEYHQDQEINDRGILIDMAFVENALKFDELSKAELMRVMKKITQLENPNSVIQMRDWLLENGLETESLDKAAVKELLKTAPPKLAKVLELRQQLAKSSVKKYQAMQNVVCKDNRARGMFQFYGANRTGRFSGRQIQLQNLPKNSISDLKEARETVKSGDFELMNILYDNIPDTLSQLIRTAFIPPENKKFIVADFSAIEARVIAWLAGEEWRVKLFEDGGDIYCQSASQMFGVPVEKNGINGHLRQKGKIAELACIAEGQPVLTDRGLVPIEKVTLSDKLWDGEEWVTHEGVIYKGEREVISYDGLTATADHLVWVEGKSQPLPFGKAAADKLRLLCVSENCSNITHTRKAKVYDIRNAGRNHRFTVSGKLVHNCGYGGSVGALKAMGALEMGLTEDELQPLVSAWRESNPNIVNLWWDIDEAVKRAIKERSFIKVKCLRIFYRSGILFIELPSGRCLSYIKPKIGENKFGGESVTYEGIGATKKWERLESYGPKFVENIIQGIARDLLMYSMKILRNCSIVAHVHDELIIEADERLTLDEVCKQMSKVPPWAKGLSLKADGYECEFYKKE